MSLIIKPPKKGDKLKEADLKKFEKTLGTTLPDEYRKFLLKYNGGYPNPAFIDIPKNDYCRYPDDMGTSVEFLCGIHKDPALVGIDLAYMIDKYKITEQQMPDELLPIGGDIMVNLICIGLQGQYRNKVYYWDQDWAADPEKENQPFWKNVTEISESFDKFLEDLHEAPE